MRTQVLLRHPQEQAQSSTLEIGVAGQEVAQALGHREHPLAHLARGSPALIHWAWAVNACASVVAAVLATLLAIHLGSMR